MAGLRQKQKINRDRRIMEVATGLFRARGYESVKMEEIAAEAEVSVGTLYNYFSSKGDLLTAIVARAVDKMVDEGAALVEAPPKSVEAAINGLLFSYLDQCLDHLSREMWGRAMAQSITQPQSLSGRRYNALDTKILDQVCRMLERLHALGRLRESVVPRDVGEMFFHSMNNQFYDLARYEDMSLEDYKQAVARQNKALLRAIEA